VLLRARPRSRRRRDLPGAAEPLGSAADELGDAVVGHLGRQPGAEPDLLAGMTGERHLERSRAGRTDLTESRLPDAGHEEVVALAIAHGGGHVTAARPVSFAVPLQAGQLDFAAARGAE